MKKFLLLFSFILLFSCSKEDSNLSDDSSTTFLEKLDGKAFLYNSNEEVAIIELYNRNQFMIGFNIWEQNGCRTEKFVITNNLPVLMNDGPDFQYTTTFSIIEETTSTLELLATTEYNDNSAETYSYRFVILSNSSSILETINGDPGRTYTLTEKLTNYCSLL
jgi:hypothetical protein